MSNRLRESNDFSDLSPRITEMNRFIRDTLRQLNESEERMRQIFEVTREGILSVEGEHELFCALSNKLEFLLSNRPRKCLNYKTPSEDFLRYHALKR